MSGTSRSRSTGTVMVRRMLSAGMLAVAASATLSACLFAPVIANDQEPAPEPANAPASSSPSGTPTPTPTPTASASSADPEMPNDLTASPAP